ncbi:phosphatidic acid phosphatase type 2/haloperoxidase family protein [Rhodotorula toruloides]|uniref:Phosphatidic acid phosphatase type 2/haloperoxidase family protein n=1 Tax=Rhodotorula toruloides TaxID=5286 RepID=A0A511KCD8_RHOTO|nr:phosphatidic acid phosphatase type 2/haloperoxidase family protein [Rhodotorula toruloides]
MLSLSCEGVVDEFEAVCNAEIAQTGLTIILVAMIGYFTDYAGYKREFSLTDTSIQHTFATKERVTFGECIVYAGAVPAVIIILVALIWRRSFWDMHNGLLGLLLSVSLTTVFTQVVKVTVGRPRPDLIDRCQPVNSASNHPVYGLATVALCTVQTGHIIDDGFKSFPSGHSSFAWAGLGYFALYLAGKMHLFDQQGHTIKSWIAITPPIGATLIAVSRTMDYRHHATDVIAGSILGAVIALITYHLYYPSLFSPQCHLPFSPRIPAMATSERLDSDVEEPGTASRPRQGNHPDAPILPLYGRNSFGSDGSPTGGAGIPLEANPHEVGGRRGEADGTTKPYGGYY